MSKINYIFDEYIPNMWLLFISLCLYVYIIWITTNLQAILIGVMMLTFGWSFAFAKKRATVDNVHKTKGSQ